MQNVYFILDNTHFEYYNISSNSLKGIKIMVIIGAVLCTAGFFGYIACLMIDMHFEYKSYSKEEEYKIEKITKAARLTSRLCLAAFIIGLITFSAFWGLFGN